MFKDKKVLVTGGSGMIGRQLVYLLLDEGANVCIADLRPPLAWTMFLTWLELSARHEFA